MVLSFHSFFFTDAILLQVFQFSKESEGINDNVKDKQIMFNVVPSLL